MDAPLNVLVLGHGTMGRVHTDTALALRKAGVPLEVSVVERDKERRDAAHSKLVDNGVRGRAFETLAKALDWFDRKPIDIVVMALNDPQHFPALLELRDRAYGFPALFSEKPLTETVGQSEQLKGWLGQKFVSLNTVIHFSPVFPELRKLSQTDALLEDATLIGFEAAWGKDRTKDKRPTIGIKSDIVHPLGIIMEPLGQGEITLLSGDAFQGGLAGAPENAIYALDTVWRTEKGLPVRLNADYARPDQERSVTAWYSRGGTYFAARMDFDTTVDGKKADILRVVELPMGGEPRIVKTYVGRNEDIDYGMPGIEGGKAQAFMTQSLKAFLNPGMPLPPQISNLGPSLRLQGAIESIGPEDRRLTLKPEDAVAHLDRLRLQPQAPSIDEQLKSNSMGPGWTAGDLCLRIMLLAQNHGSLDMLLARKSKAPDPYLTA